MTNPSDFLFIVSRLLTLVPHVCGLQPNESKNVSYTHAHTYTRTHPNIQTAADLSPNQISPCVWKILSTIPFWYTNQTYGNETFFFSLFFCLGHFRWKLQKIEPKCQKNQRMTSLQTRDLSFTTNKPLQTCWN